MDYLPNTALARRQMMDALGIKTPSELFSAIPESLRKTSFELPDGFTSEAELLNFFNMLSKKNVTVKEFTSYLGAGFYEHYIPAAVKYIVSRGEFSTSYTPYQAEASQGTLQAIYEYQGLICGLTGMDVSNASMYDGASALAEAAILSLRFNERRKILVSYAIHPEYRKTLKTYLANLNAEIVEIPIDKGITNIKRLNELLDKEVSCVIVQSPNFFGCIEPMDELGRLIHSVGALFVACIYPSSLGILKPPGEYGADIAIGEGQCLGNPLNFGGPGLGIFACKDFLVRRMPGRVVGATVDIEGKRGFVLTLQAREQHIRREKATSNICTNESLCALAAGVYLAFLGKKGLVDLGRINIENSHYCFERLKRVKNLEPLFKKPFFNEFSIRLKGGLTVSHVNRRLLKEKIIGGLNLGYFYPEYENCLLFCITETKTKQDIDRLIKALSG